MKKLLIAPCVGLALLAVAPEARASASPSLFNTAETFNADMKPFPKWTGSMDRYFQQREKDGGDCTQTALNKCHIQEWEKKIDSLKGQSPVKQLKAVNKYMNNHKYIVDPINWGVEDYWAIPHEFFAKFGDCEDYSIAKYLTLRRLGWDPEKMRIVVLKDMNLKAMHAVLAVEYKGKMWVMDNQISVVVDSAKIKHYQPVFSISENGWWRHKPKRSAKQANSKKAMADKMARLKALKAKLKAKKNQ